MLRYPWSEAPAALLSLAQDRPEQAAVQSTYVNTETGAPAENILGFYGLMLRAGQSVQLPVRSPSMVFHVNEGAVSVQVGNDPIALAQADTFCAPGYTPISLRNGSVNESSQGLSPMKRPCIRC
jgi:gentisate 1,2-dioxygenase